MKNFFSLIMACAMVMALSINTAYACTPRYVPVSQMAWYKNYQKALAYLSGKYTPVIPPAESSDTPADEVPSESVEADEEVDTPEMESQIQKFDSITSKVIATFEYDMQTNSLTTALSSGKGNCLVYSLYSKILCEEAEIECEIVLGTKDPSKLGDNTHIWNRVKLDEKWYWSDTSSCDFMGTDDYVKTETLAASESGYPYLYVLNVDGTYKQLMSTEVDTVAVDVVDACNTAKMSASQAKKDYEKNKK